MLGFYGSFTKSELVKERGFAALMIFIALTVTAQQRPNIIFIMSDDHAQKAISAYDGSLNSTPNIDRIAKEGAIFSNSFVCNSICSPSRAVMLTGKHSIHNGKVDNVVQSFDWSQDNFIKRLRAVGYQTALVGKIHLNGMPQGFDYSAVIPGQGDYYNPDFIENGKRRRIKGHITPITTQLALQWLEKRNKNKPFVLLYHQKAPHRPWMPEPKHFKTFEGKQFPLPNNFFDDFNNRQAAATHEMGIGASHIDLVYDLKLNDKEATIPSIPHLRKAFNRMYNRMDAAQKAVWDAYYDPIIADFKRKNLQGRALAVWKYNRYLQDYLACIQSVDEGVGQVLDYLDDNNLTENTIVVYTSDQGFYLGEHGWFDKRFMYEESLRTPFLMRYPKKIKPNTVVEKMIQNIDYAPTLLSYAGVQVPNDIQGLSFKKILENPTATWRDAIYYTYYEFPAEHHVPRHYGIRTQRYKLIHFYYDVDVWELYDLQKDPQEMNNLYDQPSYAKIQAMMHQKLIATRQKYGDSTEKDRALLEKYLAIKRVRATKKQAKNQMIK